MKVASTVHTSKRIRNSIDNRIKSRERNNNVRESKDNESFFKK